MDVKRFSLALVAATLAATAGPDPASAQYPWHSEFRTPKKAAFCSLTDGRVWTFYCWTPNDGFVVSMRQYGKARKSYRQELVGYEEPPKRILRFGQRWRTGDWRCTSRRSGLTCRNRDGHGWWLGRFRGYRLF